MTFEETKQRKLNRLIGLRIMNWIGMVAWIPDFNGEAKQHLRLIHPVSWIWIAAMVIFSVLSQGIPDTISDLRHTLKNDTVWY